MPKRRSFVQFPDPFVYMVYLNCRECKSKLGFRVLRGGAGSLFATRIGFLALSGLIRVGRRKLAASNRWIRFVPKARKICPRVLASRQGRCCRDERKAARNN